MTAFKCVIFDMDGTLTETNRLIFESFNHIARRYLDKEFSESEIMKMFGPPEEGALLHIVRKDQLEQAMKEYLSFYRAHTSKLARVIPGIEEVLKFLKAQCCKLAIFTGKGSHTTRITLEEFGIRDYFDFVVTGNDVQAHKPSAEGIHKIMQHFGLIQSQVLMVGDAVSDVKAAHESGVKIAAVLWDSYAKGRVLEMKTDYVFHQVAEFYGWLKVQFA